MTDSDSDDVTDSLIKSRVHKCEEESLLQEEHNETKTSKNIHNKGRSSYPKTVFLILGTEFCERFNYYGMKTILVIYLTEWLGLAYHSAVALFHLFSMMAYFSPLLGAIIADGYLGRFRTILYISMVYGVGTLVLALTALPPPEIYGPVVGLLLISLGTGGIKPCVTAFGGDQFSSHQEKERMAFFSAFYFMINLGSMLSTFITPILRADVHCIGNSCYPLAFGISTILMFMSIVIFLCGRKHYKHVPPTGNLFGQVIRCIGHGLKMRIKQGKHESVDSHWLNYAVDKYEESFVEDVKALLKVLWLFLPLPLFWALFDQQGSRWTLQAVEMNGDVGSLGRIKPDQLQVINPLLILLFIPLFDRLIYPCLNKVRLPNKPLQRMCAGMAFCCVSFIVAGFVQLKMDSLKEAPVQENSGVTFINSGNCTLYIQSSFYNSSCAPFTMSPFIRTNSGNNTMSFLCKDQENITQTAAIILNLKKNEAVRVIVLDDGPKGELSVYLYPNRRKKDTDGRSVVSIVSFLNITYNGTVQLKPYRNHQAQEKGSVNISAYQNEASDFTTVEPGLYQLVYRYQDPDHSKIIVTPVEPILNLGSGSVQTLVLRNVQLTGNGSSQVSALQFISLKENELSMAWLIPQYVLITIGEILFSITGLAFAYSQAPSSMKSLLQAAWQLCVAIGDLIVVIVAQTQLMPSQSAEFFMFAFIMGLDTVLFAVMAYLYKSRPPAVHTDTDTESLVRSNGGEGDVQLRETSSEKRD